MGWLNRIGKSPKADTPSAAAVRLTPLQRHAVRAFPDMPQDEAERRLEMAYAHLLADGHDLEIRLVAEVAFLIGLDPEDLADRFEHTPLPRIDPYPEEERACLAWLEDVLRSEHTELIEGRINIDHALKIASFDRGGVPSHILPAPSFRSGAPRRTDDEIENQAGQIAKMPTKFLRNRFKSLPGVLDADIPEEHRTSDRIDWITVALRAEETRLLSGLLDNPQTEWSSTLLIEFDNIDFKGTDDGLLSFTGLLSIDREPLCEIESPGDGSYHVTAWAAGSDESDLELIEGYVPVVSPQRSDANGERPTFLIDLILDRVMTEFTIMRYEAAAQDCVMFCPDIDAEVPEIFSVPIPDGGTKEEAKSRIEGAYPSAIILDDMNTADAAMLWATLT